MDLVALDQKGFPRAPVLQKPEKIPPNVVPHIREIQNPEIDQGECGDPFGSALANARRFRGIA